MAKWNGTAWSNPGAGAGNGPNYLVYALAVASNGDLYAGGIFNLAGGASANRVARWNGSAWGGLGTGVGNGMNDFVSAVAVASNGDVYVGGNFTRAGGASANRVARWNGSAWSSLGAGLGNGLNSYSGSVMALAVAGNGDVYAGGVFTQANGISTAGFVEKWNGTAWVSLGTATIIGSSSGISALAVAGNGDVYAGGNFAYIGSTQANYVAKWNGTAWSSLGTGAANGVNYVVNALAVAGNGDVYVGGRFGLAGGASANRIARWNGTAWSSLGTGTANGLDADVTALAVAGNGDVYAGWAPTFAGGLATNHIAKWNGTAWSSLGTGLNGGVNGLALGPTGQVYVGGSFATTGDGSKVMVNFGIYDPSTPLATAAPRAAPAAQLFPNPAHGSATLRLPADAPRRSLTLSDAQGRVVRRYPAPTTAEAALDLRGLPAGVYLVRCGDLRQRLVVE